MGLEYEDVNQTIGLKAQHIIYQTRTWHLEAFAGRYGPTHTLSGYAMIRAEAFDEKNMIKLEKQPKRNRFYFSGNKDLKAEHARNYDVGFNAQGSPGKPWLKSWNWEAAAFAHTIANGIANIYDSRGVGYAINVSRTRNRGVETDVKFELGEIVSASMSATWQQPINVDESNIENITLILPGRFPFSYKSRIETKHLSNRTFLEILVEDGMCYDSQNLHPC